MSQKKAEKKEITIEFLNHFLEEPSCHLSSWGSDKFEIPFQIKPKDFLNYAEFDLNTKYNHHLINAYSNIKRAIDCQMDSLLYVFGLLEKSKKENWRYPSKIQYLNKLGVVSPRILNRINQKRNLLEHDYISPDENNVEDALDVAILFLAYTDKYIKDWIRDCEFGNDELFLEISFNRKDKKIEITQSIDETEQFEVNFDSDKYQEFLKFLIKLNEIK